MKRLMLLIFCIAAKLSSAQNLIITNVNVIPIEGKEHLLKNQTVIIKEGKLRASSPLNPNKQEITPKLILTEQINT